MFNLWTRSGWGKWTLVDPDHAKLQDSGCHTGLECHAGFQKVDVVKNIADNLMPQQPSKATAIAEYATGLEIAVVRNSLDLADIVIDATTTLDFPRAIAAREQCQACLIGLRNTFGTRSGDARGRCRATIRLDALAVDDRHVISEPLG